MRRPRWLGTPQGYEGFRRIGWRESAMLYAAVLFTFAVLGFFIDLSSLERLTPWPSVIVAALLNGVASVMFVAGAIRKPWWFLGGFGAILASFLLRDVLPRGTDPALHPRTISQILTQARFDGLGCLLSAILGYTLFVSFIGRQGTRIFRLDTEIGLAREIHSALAPPLASRAGRIELAGRSVPSSEVGGDLLDAFERDGVRVALVADVSGHGVPAGTLMAMVRSAIRVRLDTPASLEALCADLHRHIVELGRTDRFVTLVALRFSSPEVAEWTNAGHPPLLRLARGATTVERLESLSVPLGIPGEHRFAAATTPYGAGDTFVLFTDGLSEVADRDGRQFGIEGIERILLARRDATPGVLVDAIETAARAHGRADDDQTVLVVRIRDDEGGRS